MKAHISIKGQIAIALKVYSGVGIKAGNQIQIRAGEKGRASDRYPENVF
jgi:hypothetical protein